MMSSIDLGQWFPNGGEFGTFQGGGGIAHMFCHFYMIKAPLVSIFQITNFGKGNTKNGIIKGGIRGKSVGTTDQGLLSYFIFSFDISPLCRLPWESCVMKFFDIEWRSVLTHSFWYIFTQVNANTNKLLIPVFQFRSWLPTEYLVDKWHNQYIDIWGVRILLSK